MGRDPSLFDYIMYSSSYDYYSLMHVVVSVML